MLVQLDHVSMKFNMEERACNSWSLTLFSNGLDCHSWSDYEDKVVGMKFVKFSEWPYIHKLNPHSTLNIFITFFKVKTSGNTVPTPAGQLPKNMNTNNFPNVPAASIATESPREDAENEEEEAERHFDTVYRCAFISWEVECFCWL